MRAKKKFILPGSWAATASFIAIESGDEARPALFRVKPFAMAILLLLTIAMFLPLQPAQALQLSKTVYWNTNNGWMNWMDSSAAEAANHMTFGGNVYVGNDTMSSADKNYSFIVYFNISTLNSDIPAGSTFDKAVILIKLATTGAATSITANSFPNFTIHGIDNNSVAGSAFSGGFSYNEVNALAAASANNVTLAGWNDTQMLKTGTTQFFNGKNMSFTVSKWFQWMNYSNGQNLSVWVNHTVNSSGSNAFGYMTCNDAWLEVKYTVDYPDEVTSVFPPATIIHTNTSNTSFFINASMSSMIGDTCLLEHTNSSGTVNLSMTRIDSAQRYSDTCNITVANTGTWFSYRIFANNTYGEGNYSRTYNVTIDRIDPNATSVTQDSQCYQVGGSAIISWIQDDNTNIQNSTCIWTSPGGTDTTIAAASGSGSRSCSIPLTTTGTWQWHLFLNDSAGNDIDYYAGVSVAAAGACGGGGGSTGGGGGGGGGGSYVPVPVNVSFEPVITPEQIRQLPATQAWQAIIQPRIGPFSVFHIFIFAYALYYFRKPAHRKGQNLLFVGAIIAFAFIILWQASGLDIQQALSRIRGP